MKEITKDMTIANIIEVDRGIIPIFMKSGMHCVGCPSAQAETLEEAGLVHGLDINNLITEINNFLQA